MHFIERNELTRRAILALSATGLFAHAAYNESARRSMANSSYPAANARTAADMMPTITLTSPGSNPSAVSFLCEKTSSP